MSGSRTHLRIFRVGVKQPFSVVNASRVKCIRFSCSKLYHPARRAGRKEGRGAARKRGNPITKSEGKRKPAASDVPLELVLLCLLLELGEERGDDLRVLRRLAERGDVLWGNGLASDARDERGELDGVRDGDADEVRLQAVAVDVKLRDEGTAAVDALDVLERDVFSLGELHDVLRRDGGIEEVLMNVHNEL